MVRKTTLALGLAGGLVATAGAWNIYQRRSTETVPYTVVATVGDVELRRYPPAVLAETTASSQNEAFGRLFRYITGQNESSDEIAMTAPVEMAGRGETIPMTAPVEVSSRGESNLTTGPVETSEMDDDEIRMAFFLPTAYDVDSAPRPTNEDVELVVVPERTLAVRRFSWRPTADRVASETERLLDTLSTADVPVVGDPFFMGYDAPWTLPFLRRNEVAVEVDSDPQF